MPKTRAWLLVIALCSLPLGAEGGDDVSPTDLAISPGASVTLGRSDRLQVLVSGTVEGRRVDLTRRASIRPEGPGVVAVDGRGRVTATGTGVARVVAALGGARAELTVRVEGDAAARPTFERDVQPRLARLGCNSGPCHGKASGQGGFKLSLLGFDPDSDYGAIARDAFGRRAWPGDPDGSLLLAKAAARVPHGGGPRVAVGDLDHRALRAWIASGLPRDPEDAPRLAGIAVAPTSRTLRPAEDQQLAVTARYSDGSTRDVTHLTAFQSSETAVVAVSEDGLIRAGSIPGEAAITARFEGNFDSCEVAIPLPGEVPADAFAGVPSRNFVDDHVWAKLRVLGIAPSEPAGDATFLRRASLDVIGRLPSPEETRAFLADGSPDKRDRLVEALLDRPEYADHWASKWADLLRPNPYRVGIKAVLTLDAWIRDAFRRNLPYDQFARSVVAARGGTFSDGPAVVFRDRRQPEEVATMMSQLFLGVRLECAKCHHHPFEAWSQDDFYGFAAFFARVGRKGTGLSPPISGSEEFIFAGKSGSVNHPLTGKVLPPKPLTGTAPKLDDPEADPRDALAAWMTAPDNPYFARVIANRVWAELMGRGIVDPVDDLRATNPPSNGPLLDALADDFRKHGHDLKHLIRTILRSQVYGLSSTPNDRNVADGRNFSRRYRRRLRAEVLLDATSDITGVSESFDGAPPETRAAALWTVRTESLFLDAFGRPDPNQDPPCERTSDTSVVQALHLMNAPKLHAKITSELGRAAQLARSDKPPAAIVEELYLRAYGRPPTAEEVRTALEVFTESAPDRRRAVEDLLWGPPEHAGIRLRGLTRPRGRSHERPSELRSRQPPRLPPARPGHPDRRRPGRRPPAPGSGLGRPGSEAEDELHPGLDGWRTQPLRDLRPQARRPEGDPGRLQADRDEGLGHPPRRADDEAGRDRRQARHRPLDPPRPGEPRRRQPLHDDRRPDPDPRGLRGRS